MNGIRDSLIRSALPCNAFPSALFTQTVLLSALSSIAAPNAGLRGRGDGPHRLEIRGLLPSALVARQHPPGQALEEAADGENEQERSTQGEKGTERYSVKG